MSDFELDVVLCSYNGGDLLRQAVDSILAQTFKHFRLVLVDDGSTDKSIDEVAAINDERVTILRKANTGLTDSLNFALSYCDAPFIARHDADDLSAPERFARQLEFLKTQPECGLLGSSATIIDDDGDEIGLLDLPDSVQQTHLNSNQFVHGSLMFRKALIEKLNGYRAEFRYAQDYDLTLRAQEMTQVLNLSEPLYCLRYGRQRISIDKAKEQAAYACLAQHCAQQRRASNHHQGGVSDDTGDDISTGNYDGQVMSFLPADYVVADNNHVLSYLYLRSGFGKKARACLNAMSLNTLTARVKNKLYILFTYLPKPLLIGLFRLLDNSKRERQG